jgi:hypothetical protein
MESSPEPAELNPLEYLETIRKTLANPESFTPGITRVVVEDPLNVALYQLSSRPQIAEDDRPNPARDGADWAVDGTPAWAIKAVDIAFKLGSVGSAVSGILTLIQLFKPNNAQQLHVDALRSFGQIVRREIDNSLFELYSREVTILRSKLLMYGDSLEDDGEGDVDILKSIALDGFSLPIHLNSFGIRGMGGFVMAAGLHLCALKSISRHHSRYRRTYDRERANYSSLGIQLAEKTKAHFLKRVGTCEINPRRCRPRGECNEPSGIFSYDWGEEHRHFNTGNEGEIRRDCERAQAHYYQSLTVTPIQTIVNPVIEICTKWAQ